MHDPSQALSNFLLKAGEGPAQRLADGSLFLDAPPRVQAMMRGLRVLGQLLAVAGVVAAWFEPAALVLTALGLIAWLVARRSLRVAVLLDGRGIGVRDASGRHRRIDWRDLSDLRFVIASCEWRLAGKKGPRVRFSAALLGGAEFPWFVRDHVTAAQWREWQKSVAVFQARLRQAGVAVYPRAIHGLGGTIDLVDDDGLET